MATKKDAKNDFWLIAPYGWGSEENMVRIQKDDASTPLQALNQAVKGRETSPEGYTLLEEMSNHGADTVFVYDCKEVGEYQQSAWREVK